MALEKKMKIGLSDDDKNKMSDNIYEKVKVDLNNDFQNLENNFNENYNREIETQNIKIDNLVDGSPKGVYDNLNALQTAYPDGEAGVYLTKDNGHWYFWNGTEWVDGGVYLNYTYIILNIEYVNGSITCDYDFAKEVPLYAILKNVITADISKYYAGNKEEIQETYTGEDESTYHKKEITFYFKGFGKVLIVYDELEGTTYTIEPDDIYTKDEVNAIVETGSLNIEYLNSLPTNDINENIIYGINTIGEPECYLYVKEGEQITNLSEVMGIETIIIESIEEIDTSKSYAYGAYNINEDIYYMVQPGGEIVNFKEVAGNNYRGAVSSQEEMIEPGYYVLINGANIEQYIKYYIWDNTNSKWFEISNEEKIQKIIGELNSNLTSQMEGLSSNVQQNFVPINSTEATYIHRGNTTYKVSDTFGMSSSQISRDNYIYDFYIDGGGFETYETNSTKKGEFDIYTNGPTLTARFTDNDYNTTPKGGSSYLYLTPVAMNFTGKIYENSHRVATKDEVNSIIEEKTKIINITYNLISEVIMCDYDFANNVPNQALLEVIDGDDHIYYVGNKEEILNNNVGDDGRTVRDLTYYFNGFGKIKIYQNDIDINEVTYTVYLEESATQEYVDTKIEEKITSVLEADY